MICPRCACTGREIATRRLHGIFPVRVYCCDDGHTYESLEVYRGNVDRRTLRATVAGIASAALAAARRVHVELLLRAGEQRRHIADRLGVTPERVRQIARGRR